MKLNWQHTDIKPNDGDIIIVILFRCNRLTSDIYRIGEYDINNDDIIITDPNEGKHHIQFSSYDLWTKIDLPEMPVC